MTMPSHSESNGQERVGSVRASYLNKSARELFNQAMVGRLLPYIDRDTLDEVIEEAQLDVQRSGFGAKVMAFQGESV